MIVRLSLLTVVAGIVPGMACQEPYYDDTIGVEGVATDVGALAGTFALQSQAMDQANTVLGPIDTGGVTWSLVVRTIRVDQPDRYDERIEVCDVENFESAGLTTVNTPATIDAIPEGLATLVVDHATGAFHREPYREFWAVRDLDDDAPFPTDKESPVFYDMDDDGQPGATVLTSGLVDGEVYVAQRKTIEQTGVVQGEDVSFGLSKVKKEGTVLAASNDFLLNEAPREPHPNPKNSWFMELRIGEGDGCDAVLAARDDETLPIRRPF